MQPLVTGKGDKVNTRFIYDSMNRHKSKVSKDLLPMSPRPAHIGLGETHRERNTAVTLIPGSALNNYYN